MKEKGKMRKSKKILIRVNLYEKMAAENLSKEKGMNVSEFFRRLLEDYKTKLTLRQEIAHQFEVNMKKYTMTKRR